jgi:hypothetical protein
METFKLNKRKMKKYDWRLDQNSILTTMIKTVYVLVKIILKIHQQK